MRNIYLLILSVFVLITSCQKNGERDFDREPILENSAVNLIIPAYQKVLKSSENFEEKLSTLKKEPTKDHLNQLQETWVDLALTWQAAEVYSFGPIKELLYDGTIYYNPVDTSAITSLVAYKNTQGVDLSSEGSNKKGLQAMEFLLFEKQDYLINVEVSKGYFDYLSLLNQELQSKLVAVVDEWNTSYKEGFIKRTGNAANDGLTLITNQMIFLIEDLKNDKLGKPLGKYESSAIQPELVEAPYSQISLKLIKENILAIQESFNGGLGQGVDDYIIALDLKDEEGILLSRKINEQINKVLLSISNINTSLKQSIKNKDPELDQLYLELLNLSILIKTDMMSQLGLLTIYSDNDGD